MTKIENEIQYRSLMQRINELLEVVNDNTPEDDVRNVELVILSNLVADYEDEHYPVKTPSLIETLKLRMFEMGMSQSALASMLGMNQSKLSEIISGKSEPTLKQAKKMAKECGRYSSSFAFSRASFSLIIRSSSR